MRKRLRKLTLALVRRYRYSTVSQWAVFVIDTLLVVLAFFIVEAFRYGGLYEITFRAVVVKFLLMFMVTLLTFFFTGTFRGIIRHAGMHDVYKIL